MTPAQALGVEALRVFAWGLPMALAYLGLVQWRRHRPSSLALWIVALAIAVWSVATGGTAASATGAYLAGAGGATLLALGWKLALRRRPGFRDGETVVERLLPILIVADLLLLLFAWPAVAEWQAGLVQS